jgi:uncharacterized protein YycO
MKAHGKYAEGYISGPALACFACVLSLCALSASAITSQYKLAQCVKESTMELSILDWVKHLNANNAQAKQCQTGTQMHEITATINNIDVLLEDEGTYWLATWPNRTLRIYYDNAGIVKTEWQE